MAKNMSSRFRYRYEVGGDDSAWRDAERQALRATKGGNVNPVVSVKSQAKRKAGPTAAEVYEEAFGEKKHKKVKKERRGKGN